MVDLGSHAGHGPGRNVSDALLWLRSFSESGSLVIGVDAFEDFALDLQHRFDELEPFASMRGVTKLSVHASLLPLGAQSAEYSACPGAPLGSCVDMSFMASFSNLMCTRTDFFDDYVRRSSLT